jgi:glycosyltransferase involved in cell wall biosynthesis
MILNTVPEGILGAGIPQVTIVHDLVPILFPDEFPRQQYYFRFIVPRILRASRIVIAVSESTRRDVIRAYGLPAERVRVIHSGCDASAYFCNGLHDTSGRPAVPYFLYVGNLLPHKNLLRLDACRSSEGARPCRLIIRGDGKSFHARALRERVETLVSRTL